MQALELHSLDWQTTKNSAQFISQVFLSLYCDSAKHAVQYTFCNTNIASLSLPASKPPFLPPILCSSLLLHPPLVYVCHYLILQRKAEYANGIMKL